MGGGWRGSQEAEDWSTGQHYSTAGRKSSTTGWHYKQRPSGSSLRARWVLADFGGLFRLVRGPNFDPKEAGTQVENTVNQTKEI